MATYIPGSKPRITEAGNKAARLAAEEKRKKKKEKPKKEKKTKGSLVEGVELYPNLSTGPSTNMQTETPVLGETMADKSKYVNQATNQGMFDPKGQGMITAGGSTGNIATQLLQGFIGGDTAGREIESMPTAYQTGTLLGQVLSIAGIGSIGTSLTKTAVQEASTIGKLLTGMGTKGSAKLIPVNSATEKATASWLTKLLTASKTVTTTNPETGATAVRIVTTKSGLKTAFSISAIVGGIMAVIGTYPFAGFIKEEALQTLGLATRAAQENGDVAGAEKAIALQKEILAPDLWKQILGAIPFTNILSELDDFYNAANTKVAIDDKITEDMKNQQENGETEDQKWDRIKQEEDDSEKAIIDYYNQERKKLIEWENNAAANKREEEARFWAEERNKQSKKEEEDRKAAAEFWLAYRKMVIKMQDESRPSKLNFGII